MPLWQGREQGSCGTAFQLRSSWQNGFEFMGNKTETNMRIENYPWFAATRLLLFSPRSSKYVADCSGPAAVPHPNGKRVAGQKSGRPAGQALEAHQLAQKPLLCGATGAFLQDAGQVDSQYAWTMQHGNHLQDLKSQLHENPPQSSRCAGGACVTRN